MTFQTLLFSISIIFQLSGAILLILHYFAKTQKIVVVEYFSDNKSVKLVEPDNIKMKLTGEKRLSGILSGIYTNRMAFIYIVIGYALSVVGKNECSNPYILMIVLIIGGIIISTVTFLAINKIAKNTKLLSKHSIINREDINFDAWIETEK